MSALVVEASCDSTSWRTRLSALPVATRLRALLWVVGIASALVIAWAVAVVLTTPAAPARWLVLISVITLCSDWTYVNIRFGHNTEGYTWAEFGLVLGLALLPTAQLILVSAVFIAVPHVLARRPVQKVVFNSTSFTLGTALSAGVVHLLVEPSWDRPILSAVALSVGALVFLLWNGVTIAAAIAWSQDIPFQSVYRKGSWLRLIVCLGNLVVALSVLGLARWSEPTLIVLPPLVALIYITYRGYLRAVQDREVWRQLEAAGKELSRLDESEVAEAAVARAAALFEADVIELSLALDDGSATSRVYVGGTAGVDSVRDEPSYRGDSLAVTTYRVISQPAATGGEVPVETCVVAPLIGPRGSTGVLRVGFHGPVKLSKREQQLLTTFAHTVSATVQNARLYAEMRDQAANNAHAAEHDALTGLANRSLLQRRTTEAVAAAAASGRSCGLLLVDLDHFKEINDTLGHTAGDALLREIASRLGSAVSLDSTVARLGGDEFAVLLPGLRSTGDADRVAERLLRVLADPIDVDGLRLSIEGSMGVACFPSDGATFEELFQRADVAMYQAKTARGSYSHYRSELDESSIRRLSLIADLREAIEGDQLLLHFQPQLDVATGEPVGAEALVRWNHPVRGLLGPEEFVPLVEYSGLVRAFTNNVVDKAVAECALWHQLGCDLTIAVNLSARNLLDRRLPGDVATALRRHGLPADRLVLEITETTILHELEVVEEVLGQLRRMGVILSVDDFGTGYSSLAFLQRVAVHELKIDRSFISNMVRNDNDEAIARATVQLAQSLGLRTVAEGVDSAATLDRVAALGCDAAQGYHWSAPVSGEEVRALLGVPAVASTTTLRVPRARASRRLATSARVVDLR